MFLVSRPREGDGCLGHRVLTSTYVGLLDMDLKITGTANVFYTVSQYIGNALFENVSSLYHFYGYLPTLFRP